MCPLNVFLDETLKESSCLRCTTVRGFALVVQVRVCSFHCLAMLLHDRQSPERLESALGAIEKLLRELIVVGEKTSCLVAKSDFDGASESSKIDHLLRGELSLHIGHSVSENEPALSVGVSDLDGQALH